MIAEIWFPLQAICVRLRASSPACASYKTFADPHPLLVCARRPVLRDRGFPLLKVFPRVQKVQPDLALHTTSGGPFLRPALAAWSPLDEPWLPLRATFVRLRVRPPVGSVYTKHPPH